MKEREKVTIMDKAFLSAYAKDLTANDRRLLEAACDRVMDEAFDAVEAYSEWSNGAPERKRIALFQSTSLSMYLPERFTHRYTPLFMRKFAVALAAVGLKMATGNAISISSTAEELAFSAILESAEKDNDAGEVSDGMSDRLANFSDLVLEDTDVEMLFSDAFDGIEDSLVGQSMGVGNLEFERWFVPFRDDVVHPYLSDTEPPI